MYLKLQCKPHVEINSNFQISLFLQLNSSLASLSFKHIIISTLLLTMLNFPVQNVKAYLRRGTARESLLCYKEAAQGENAIYVYISHIRCTVLILLTSTWKFNLLYCKHNLELNKSWILISPPYIPKFFFFFLTFCFGFFFSQTRKQAIYYFKSKKKVQGKTRYPLSETKGSMYAGFVNHLF